ncbi:MAG: DNA repair protein RecN [Bowdeniella nasicola]|nr:DNA repair protein RecN [Bowdeniella nasicola]
MIDQLTIRSIGVIDYADLSFGSGLTVITGETGAGKTMLLTAIGLIAGQRADTSRVRAGAVCATVDAAVIDPDGNLQLADFATRHDCELDDGALLIGRTVPAQGRARASLGGRAVPASLLAELAENTITIHGQAEQLRLRSTAYQREMLDAAAGSRGSKARSAYEAAYRRHRELVERQRVLASCSQERAQRAAALRAGISAIDKVSPEEGEDDCLRLQAERLTNIDDVRRAAQRADLLLNDADRGALAQLADATRELAAAARYDDALAQWASQLDDAARLGSDAANELAAYASTLTADAGELDEIHARRAEITTLLRMYGPTIADALQWRVDAEQELATLDDSPEALEQLSRDVEAAAEILREKAAALRDIRRTAGKKLAQNVTAELHALAMPKATLRIQVEAADYAGHGADDIRFELQPHPGSDYRPLGQGASGGELSRLMLALEVCAADVSGTSGRTFVFDEVDAGVGGAAATAVGARLARLAVHHQVFVVTHIAQVAAFANGHIVIRKDDSEDRASTQAYPVTGEQRTREIARMLGGTHSENALRHAAELIQAANVAR